VVVGLREQARIGDPLLSQQLTSCMHDLLGGVNEAFGFENQAQGLALLPLLCSEEEEEEEEEEEGLVRAIRILKDQHGCVNALLYLSLPEEKEWLQAQCNSATSDLGAAVNANWRKAIQRLGGMAQVMAVVYTTSTSTSTSSGSSGSGNLMTIITTSTGGLAAAVHSRLGQPKSVRPPALWSSDSS